MPTPTPNPLATYAFKRAPQPHQLDALRMSWERPSFAILAEQRTRKSKIIIDNAAILYEQGKIDALIIIAMPGRVHSNWVKYELAADLPDRISRESISWDASKASSKDSLANQEFLLLFKGLAILTCNGEATITPKFRAYLKRFLDRRRAMLVVDEFSLIMARSNKRAQVLTRVGQHKNAIYKRILDGTPAETPLNLFTPFNFLSSNILGFTSFYAFKHRYARWKKEMNWRANKSYEALDRGPDKTDSPYQNLDELREKIRACSFRVTRKELGCDVPKVYQQHSFQLTPKQRKVYDEVEATHKAELSTGTVTAAHALTRILRLQQITCNYWPSEKIGIIHQPCDGEGCDGCDDLGVTLGKTDLKIIDPAHNPRIEAFKEVLEMNAASPTVVWARFDRDVDQAMVAARELKLAPVQYDGRCSNEEKDAAQADFQAGKKSPLIGKARAGGRGTRLSTATLLIYYSNEFSLLSRLQSEDRAEDLGKQEATGVVDLIAEDTVDDRLILPALRAKKTLADYVMGERGGKWL